MRILIIEDNEDIVDNIFEYFELKGHVVDAARDGLSGLHLAVTNEYDAIILDLMLPGIDGIEICRKLRTEAHSAVPIIMLTAKDSLESKLMGFEFGADDYLVKPFALAELEARLHALVRRMVTDSYSEVLTVGDLEFNLGTREVFRAGTRIELNPITRNILCLLMKESPRMVSRNRIEAEIWGEELPDSDTLRSHIYNLRNAIDKPFSHSLLKTVPREGYRLVDEHAQD